MGRPPAVVGRLLRPLDDAKYALAWLPATRHPRRSANDAIGLILLRCAAQEAPFWAWSTEDWLALIGTSSAEFQRPWPGWLDGSVRPYVAAYAYLLCGFTDFHRLGSFNRLALAWRVFGREAVEEAIRGVSAVLRGWDYRTEDQRVSAALCQALLLNRSPRLEDLCTEAFERLREHPAMRRHHLSALHCIQRAAAGLGYADPPPMTNCFFEQCPHRMACARCDFYLPKDSAKAPALEAKANLQRMLASIPLTDEERAAVEDDTAALDRLVERLADVPTPAGRHRGNCAPTIASCCR